MIPVVSERITMSLARTLLLIIILPMLQSCNYSEVWKPDVSLLREGSVPENDLFIKSVTTFYELFKGKKWELTYEYRTKHFKSIVSLNVYMNSLNDMSKSWTIYNYNIKAVTVKDRKNVELIIEMFETHKKIGAFRVVNWVFEDNIWAIENDGSVRSPFGHKLVGSKNSSLGESDE